MTSGWPKVPWGLLLTLLAAGLAHGASLRGKADLQVMEDVLMTGLAFSQNATRQLLADEGSDPILKAQVELPLCDCEPASGEPHGLTCTKEGFYISNFEREGSWLSGGGLVPLSVAQCCRPCVPDELPENPAIAAGDNPVAIVSIGCHPSSGKGADELKCEPQGSSFVSGFQTAVRVSASIDAYYPVGTVQCCTPSVLLTSGDAWELERCDCEYSKDINCGGPDSGRLLMGFDRWRMTRTGQYVPIAPAQCCKACLSDRVHPIDSCFDLAFCSGHGVCTLGACECTDGYTGADCSNKPGASAGGLPQWLISLIILGSCTTLSALILAVGRLLRRHNAAAAEENADGDGLREPLLLRIEDDVGSVGSEDTTDCEETGTDSEHDGEHPLSSPTHSAHSAREDLEAEHSESEASEAESHAEEQPEEEPPQPPPQPPRASRRHARHARAAEIQVSQVIEPIVGVEQPETDVDTEAEEGDSGEDGAPKKDANRPRSGEWSGLPGVECSVCMTRPVQVVVVPCGHACMCRRCSRRVQKCPICRKEVLRRQRLYVGG